MITVDTGGGHGGTNIRLGGLIHSPIFWGGTALIVGTYFFVKSSSDTLSEGASTALVIVGIGAGAALMIYAARRAA